MNDGFGSGGRGSNNRSGCFKVGDTCKFQSIVLMYLRMMTSIYECTEESGYFYHQLSLRLYGILLFSVVKMIEYIIVFSVVDILLKLKYFILELS